MITLTRRMGLMFSLKSQKKKYVLIVFFIAYPLPFNRQHLSYGDCLEGMRGDYLTSSVLLCIIIVHFICTPI